MNSRTPLVVAIVLLLLPVLYVGSYLGLVVPAVQSVLVHPGGGIKPHWSNERHYRVSRVETLFWPLEQIDRRVRPGEWRLLIPKEKRSPFVPERTVTGGALPDNP